MHLNTRSGRWRLGIRSLSWRASTFLAPASPISLLGRLGLARELGHLARRELFGAVVGVGRLLSFEDARRRARESLPAEACSKKPRPTACDYYCVVHQPPSCLAAWCMAAWAVWHIRPLVTCPPSTIDRWDGPVACPRPTTTAMPTPSPPPCCRISVSTTPTPVHLIISVQPAQSVQ